MPPILHHERGGFCAELATLATCFSGHIGMNWPHGVATRSLKREGAENVPGAVPVFRAMKKFQLRMKDCDLEPEDILGVRGKSAIFRENSPKNESGQKVVSNCKIIT